jgi:hypothetical protein
MQWRLAAILAANVVGYSRLMGMDRHFGDAERGMENHPKAD